MTEVPSTFFYAAIARRIEEQLLRYWDEQSAEHEESCGPEPCAVVASGVPIGREVLLGRDRAPLSDKA